jgi:resuscitation-promoting factor RpfB
VSEANYTIGMKDKSRYLLSGGARPPWRGWPGRCWPVLAACLVFLAACATPIRNLPAAATLTPATVNVVITADGKSRTYALAPELTVREAVVQLNLPLTDADRISPAPYTRLSEGLAIKITRVTETYEIEKAVLPFASQIVRRDDRPEGEQRLLQAGVNGEEEITYRTVFEDGTQVSRSIVKRTVIKPAAPEIIVVGSQPSFTLVPISGTLAYINGRNAWIMRQSSGQRLPITTSGDLDGKIFELSPDGAWLLCSRQVSDTTSADFNTLWAIPIPAPITPLSGAQAATTTQITPPAPLAATQPISLPVANIPFYAEWVPALTSPLSPTLVETRTIAYSNAFKIPRPPGWQANNNLLLTSWWKEKDAKTKNESWVFTTTQVLDTSLWGTYGWWGTGFALSPDGTKIAFARTDAIGLIDLQTFAQSELAVYPAYNTRGDWAWFPSLRWGPDGAYIYTLVHGGPVSLELPEDSPAFDFVALSPQTGLQLELAPRAGMFANPVPSPIQVTASGEHSFQVAFLQAMDQNADSSKSRYQLGVMDRDGSNLRFIFPPEGLPGLPANQKVTWSPDGRRLAVIYEGNLWLVDVEAGISQQLTGDGLSAKVVWGN